MFFDNDEKEQKRVNKAAHQALQAALTERFEVTYFTPKGLIMTPVYIVDKETGVEYLHVDGAITPLLTPDGKPKVRK